MFSSGIVILCLSDTDDEDVEEDEDMMVADEAVDDDYDDEDIDESEQEDEETWNNLRWVFLLNDLLTLLLSLSFDDSSRNLEKELWTISQKN